MNASEKFLRFAAECEFMAKFTRNPKNKAAWTNMAVRWLRCAESFDRESLVERYGRSAKRHRKPASSWVH